MQLYDSWYVTMNNKSHHRQWALDTPDRHYQMLWRSPLPPSYLTSPMKAAQCMALWPSRSSKQRRSYVRRGPNLMLKWTDIIENARVAEDSIDAQSMQCMCICMCIHYPPLTLGMSIRNAVPIYTRSELDWWRLSCPRGPLRRGQSSNRAKTVTAKTDRIVVRTQKSLDIPAEDSRR